MAPLPKGEPVRSIAAGDQLGAVDQLGAIFAGSYRIGRLIGEGGMATVHEAIHAVTGRRVAVKLLRPRFSDGLEWLARFEGEARAAGSLNNENVVSVIDFGYAAPDAPYLVMEYLSGETLAARVAREAPLPVPIAVDIAIQACRGIGAAHAAGIVHRDVKPANLFLCRRDDGTTLVKLFDFGIAKIMRPDRTIGAPRLTANLSPATMLRLASGVDIDAGNFLGTPNYMSPEQMRGADGVDPRSDIYSLGGILFEMLSGETPHPGASYADVIDHVLTRQPTRLETLRGTLPRSLVSIIHRSIDVDPRERFASALGLATLLTSFGGGIDLSPSRGSLILPTAGQGREMV